MKMEKSEDREIALRKYAKK